MKLNYWEVYEIKILGSIYITGKCMKLKYWEVYEIKLLGSI